MLRLAEDDSAAAQGAAPGSLQSGLDLYLRLCGLQPGAHAESGGRSFSGVSRGPKCVRQCMELDQKGSPPSESSTRNITNDEKQKENCAADQFFSSLLDAPPLHGYHMTILMVCWASHIRRRVLFVRTP